MLISDEHMERLRTVKAKHESKLMRKANVVGVGIGFRKREGEMTEEPSIVVSVTHKVPGSMLDPEDVIPYELDGVPVDVQAVGTLRALDASVG
ncbi:MAG: hypothetical protein PVG71_15545 [Anaerolineae bacterium]|jgi:hypothetical protein